MKFVDRLVLVAAQLRVLPSIKLFLRWAAAISLAIAPVLSGATRFVNPLSATPTAPYTSWATAAHTIAEALAVCTSGDTTYVSGGTYTLASQLTIPGGVTLECTTGPTTATLDGNTLVRCVNMPAAGATLKGFTLKGGKAESGAGVFCIGGTVSRCILTNNRASGNSPKGGGIYCDGGTVSNCIVTNNDCTSTNSDPYSAFASGGGIYAVNQSRIEYCRVLSNTLAGYYADGAGINANNGTILSCTVSDNIAVGRWYASGGGIYMTANIDGLVRDCLVTGNNAHTDVGTYSANWASGGGVYFNGGGTMESSTVCTNVLAGDAATGSGVMYGEQIRNSIVLGNTYSAHLSSIGDVGPNYYLNPYGPSVSFDHSCTLPLPAGTGNISLSPSFVDGSYRLSTGSACLNAGANQPWMSSGTDLDGNPRLANSTVDIGAFEKTASTPPVLSQSPAGTTVYANTSVSFTAGATGLFPMTWQWRKNNVLIPGATESTYTVPGIQSSDTGAYSVSVTNAAGSVGSPAVSLAISPSRFVNLSINTNIGVSTPVTAGFIIMGGTKALLIRGAGPVLTPLGVTDALADPKLTVFQQSNIATPLLSNDNWGEATNKSAIITATAKYTGLPFSEGSKDAATLSSLAESPGGYTVQITTASGSGTTLAEVYDADPNLAVRLSNLSANRRITPTQSITAGFVIEGTMSKEVLIRGVGPALANYGLPTGYLPDPKLTVYDTTNSKNIITVATNDNWSTDASNRTAVLNGTSRAGVGLLLSDGSKDAAVVLTLTPGHLYTAEVSSADTGSGTVLVEVYEVP